LELDERQTVGNPGTDEGDDLEVPMEEGRVAMATEWADCIGVQIYADKKVDLSTMPNLIDFCPYESPDAAAKFRERGIVFWRDARSADGAIADTNFKGPAFYYQFFIHKDSGEVVKAWVEHEEREILWIKGSRVCYKKV